MVELDPPIVSRAANRHLAQPLTSATRKRAGQREHRFSKSHGHLNDRQAKALLKGTMHTEFPWCHCSVMQGGHIKLTHVAVRKNITAQPACSKTGQQTLRLHLKFCKASA